MVYVHLSMDSHTFFRKADNLDRLNGTPARARITKGLTMSLPFYTVWFRGFPACPCLAEWLPVLEAELQRRGILTGPLHIYQLIGDAAASSNTHRDGGAADLLDLPGDEDWWVIRQMGADAGWSRRYNWDGHGGMAHFHLVLRGCPHNEPARYQYDSPYYGVDHGHNGLANGGLDDGPRPLSGRTWRQGIEWAKQQEENDMPAPKDWDKDDWAAIAEHIGPALLDTQINSGTGPKAEAAFKDETVRSALKKLVRPLLKK